MIRQAKHTDLHQIADVHVRCFPKSFSTVLGKTHKCYLLKRFYKEYLDCVPELFLVAVDEKDNVVGYSMGYYCELNNYQNKFLKHNFLRIVVRMIFLLLSCNATAWKKALSFFSKKAEVEIRDEPYVQISNTLKGDLLSICLIPEKRGTGLSIELIEAFEATLKVSGRKYVQLTVEPDNQRAVRFYNKMEYKLYKIVSDKAHAMYKTLQ